MRFDSFHFAPETPYETRLALPVVQGERLLPPEVAAAARSAIINVVENGTARRLRGAYQLPGHQPLQIGGKTGTGDHRRESYGAHGRLTGSRVVSRAATFVFFLGDRFYGVVTAYVTGPEAARYQFTSALPVQVLKGLAPTLTSYFEWGQGKDAKTTSVVERRKEPPLTRPKDSKTSTSTQAVVEQRKEPPLTRPKNSKTSPSTQVQSKTPPG
jgi:hypothetical protein